MATKTVDPTTQRKFNHKVNIRSIHDAIKYYTDIHDQNHKLMIEENSEVADEIWCLGVTITTIIESEALGLRKKENIY